MTSRQCGINVNECRLFPSTVCKGYFGAKPFDRDGGKRIHMVSLAALLETTHRVPNLDYFHLFQVVQNICVNREELYEAYRRMAFNVFYENKDDHGKNFSFLYDEKPSGESLLRLLRREDYLAFIDENDDIIHLAVALGRRCLRQNIRLQVFTQTQCWRVYQKSDLETDCV